MTKGKKQKTKVGQDVEDQDRGSEEMQLAEHSCHDSDDDTTRPKTKKSKKSKTGQNGSTQEEETTPQKKKKRKSQGDDSLVDEKKQRIESRDETNTKTNNTTVQQKEKKREKMKAKREAKKVKKDAQKQTTSESKEPSVIGIAEKEGLAYLHTWQTDKANWKFNKVRQVWLLQHMYDTEKVPDADFDILLEYLDGLKGKGRQVTTAQAQQLIDKLDSESSDTECDTQSTDAKLDRAKQLLQMLT